MNKPDSNLEEIKASLSNAEEELSNISEGIETSYEKPIHENKDLTDSPNVNNKKNSDGGVWLSVIIIICIFLIGIFLGENNQQNSVKKTPVTQKPLLFSRSCGSPASQTKKTWWPVLGPADLGLLREVRTKYCGDAYIRENNTLQVASFDSWDAARSFAKRITEVTNRPFRVGQGK